MFDQKPAMPIKQIRDRFSFTQAALMAVLAALLVGAWLFTYLRLETDRRDDVAVIEAENANLAIALEAHTTSTLKGIERLLLVFAHEYETEGPEANVSALLGKMLDPTILSVYVTDASGKIVLGSGPYQGTDLSDRDFFRAHRDASAAGTLVSAPVLGRMTGKMAIPFTRRLNKRDGSFNGVIGFGVDPAYFTRIYSQMRVGRKGYAQLVGTDGIVRVRRVGDEVLYGVDLRGSNLMKAVAVRPAGNLLTLGRADNVRRYVSYRVLPDYPLVVAVGQSADEALAPFTEHRRDYLTATAAFSVLILVLGALVVYASWKETAATAELRRSEALHRVTFDHAALGITYNRPDGKFIDANRAYCAMVGYSREELLGMTYMDLMQPDTLARLPALTAELERSSRLSVEGGWMRKKGGVLRVAMEAALLRDDQGRPELIVAIVQDITERERARALLEAQLDELRRFQKVAVDRELRMMEIEEEIRRLRGKVSA